MPESTSTTTTKETTVSDTTKTAKPAATTKTAKPKRTRTPMTSPDGRRHVATSPTEVNNLLSAGYTIDKAGK